LTPEQQALLANIQAELGAAINPSLTTSSDASDLYEAYQLTLVLAAARAEGGVISYRDVFGAAPTTFTFRTSPGDIYSRRRPYCFAVIDFPNKPQLEVHMSVRVQGVSQVLHECDVAVIRADEAATCRLNSVHPRSSQVVLALECKFYTASIPLDEARGYVGLVADLQRGPRFFVVNTQSDSAERYLHRHSMRWEHQVYPTAGREVERLRNAFQTVFRDYKTAN
jgi:hypothetical protein